LKIKQIFLYDEPAVPQINLDGLAIFLEKIFCTKVIKKKSIFENITNEIAAKIAATRVFNFRIPFEAHIPTNDEIEYEVRRSSSQSRPESIVLYDGFEFQKIVSSMIPQDKTTMDIFHLIFTDRLMSTFDHADYRYHGRALISSNPSIVSTTGIIEAPAKPREYYLDLMATYSQGLNLDSIKNRYRGTYLEYGDERLGTVVEGYCMQALFYYITGQPFCQLLDCRLNNAHWQRDLLYSQLESGRLCDAHKRILKDWIILNNLNC
jgi:hypothetical protein